MIKLEHVVLASPEQMEFIIEGMRNPMNSWEKSDSGFCYDFSKEYEDGIIGCSHDCPKWSDEHYCGHFEYLKEHPEDSGFMLGNNDRNLMYRLAKAGTDHRKFMRMMPVYVRITAPLYW